MRATLLCLMVGVSAYGQNYQGVGEQHTKALEVARLASSYYWTGDKLPDWSSPTNVRILKNTGGGGGSTVFNVTRGYVPTGWRMTIQGVPHDQYSDVIPHEVDHQVRASIFGKTFPRWLDEGCANLMEGGSITYFNRKRNLDIFQYLEAQSYPDATKIQDFYAESAKLCAYIKLRKGKQALLDFHKVDKPTRHWNRIMGENVQTTRRGFLDWCRNMQGNWQQLINPRPPLFIWSDMSCTPCREFWKRFNTDVNFRRAIIARWRPIYMNARAVPRQFLLDRNIKTLPAFGNKFVGYQSGFTNMQEWYARTVKQYSGQTAPQVPPDPGSTLADAEPFPNPSNTVDETARLRAESERLRQELADAQAKAAEPVKPFGDVTTDENGMDWPAPGGDGSIPIRPEDKKKQDELPKAPTGAFDEWETPDDKTQKEPRTRTVQEKDTNIGNNPESEGSGVPWGTILGLLGVGAAVPGVGWTLSAWKAKKLAAKVLTGSEHPLLDRYRRHRRERRDDSYHPDLDRRSAIPEHNFRGPQGQGDRYDRDGANQRTVPLRRDDQEAVELLQLARLEGRDPVYDAFVGRIVADIFEESKDPDGRYSDEQRQFLTDMRLQVMDIVNEAAPFALPTRKK